MRRRSRCRPTIRRATRTWKEAKSTRDSTSTMTGTPARSMTKRPYEWVWSSGEPDGREEEQRQGGVRWTGEQHARTGDVLAGTPRCRSQQNRGTFPQHTAARHWGSAQPRMVPSGEGGGHRMDIGTGSLLDGCCWSVLLPPRSRLFFPSFHILRPPLPSPRPWLAVYAGKEKKRVKRQE